MQLGYQWGPRANGLVMRLLPQLVSHSRTLVPRKLWEQHRISGHQFVAANKVANHAVINRPTVSEYTDRRIGIGAVSN